MWKYQLDTLKGQGWRATGKMIQRNGSSRRALDGSTFIAVGTCATHSENCSANQFSQHFSTVSDSSRQFGVEIIFPRALFTGSLFSWSNTFFLEHFSWIAVLLFYRLREKAGELQMLVGGACLLSDDVSLFLRTTMFHQMQQGEEIPWHWETLVLIRCRSSSWSNRLGRSPGHDTGN